MVFEKRPTSALELGLLLVDLAEALGVHEEQIDLVDLDTALLSLVKTVVDEGKILYGDNEAFGLSLEKVPRIPRCQRIDRVYRSLVYTCSARVHVLSMFSCFSSSLACGSRHRC